MIVSALICAIPRPLKQLAWKLYHLPIDVAERLLGRRPDLTHPRRLSYVGAGDFRHIGEEFFHYFVELCGLQPDGHVLDVGYGTGRMAVPLTRYLDVQGSYAGFDIVADGIKWCQRHVATRYPNFRFHHANIYNKMYNPAGCCPASEYHFPYPGQVFDLVVSTSVFTHMLPDDLDHYLSEIARVMRPSARCLMSVFVVNAEALQLIGQGKSLLDFSAERDGYRTINKRTPEAAVAYDETAILKMLERHGLALTAPIYYGAWSGRADYLSSQDIIIVSKVPSVRA